MGRRKLLFLRSALAAIVLLSFEPAAVEADDYADLLDEIRNKEQADQLRQFVDILNGLDSARSLRAFKIMVESGKPELRELALTHGLASTDETLRALAGQTAVMSLEKLNFIMQEPNAENALKRRDSWARFGGVYVVNLKDKNTEDATAKAEDYHSIGELAMSGEILRVSWLGTYPRSFELRLNGGRYEGEFRYPFYFNVPIKVILSIR